MMKESNSTEWLECLPQMCCIRNPTCCTRNPFLRPTSDLPKLKRGKLTQAVVLGTPTCAGRVSKVEKGREGVFGLVLIGPDCTGVPRS